MSVPDERCSSQANKYQLLSPEYTDEECTPRNENLGTLEEGNLPKFEEEGNRYFESEDALPTSMDEVIDSVGTGLNTLLYLIIAVLFISFGAVNLFIAEFQVPTLNFTCLDSTTKIFDVSPVEGSECEVQHMNRSENAERSSVEQCTNFSYNNTMFETSLTEEFDLVCSKSGYREIYKIIFFFGLSASSLLGGVLSDKYGRLPVLWYTTLLMTLLTILLVTLRSFAAILLCRFFLGFLWSFLMNAVYTLAMEVSPSNWRCVFAQAMALPFSCMVSLLGLIAYLSRRWRHIQLWSSIPLFVLLIFSNPNVAQESPRWLVEQGRLGEAERVLRQSAKRNCRELPPNLMKALMNIHMKDNPCKINSEGSDSVLKRLKSLVSTWPMFKLTTISCTIWFCQGCVYISMPFRSEFFQSPFVYFMMLGLTEAPSYILALPIAMRMKRTTAVTSIFGTISALVFSLIMLQKFKVKKEWLKIMISSTCYGLASTVYMVNLVLCSELFPTSVRSTGTALVLFSGSISFNVIIFITSIVSSSAGSSTPLIILVGVSLLAAVVVQLLPDCKNKPLPQTVAEYIRIYGK